MSPVLFAVGRIDHQEVFPFDETVKIGIVHGAAGFIGDDRVLGSGGPQVERLDVVGEHVLEEWNGSGPPDDEPAHMRNVEEPRALARGQVFLHDPGRVLERHFPTAKIHHLGPEGLVPVV